MKKVSVVKLVDKTVLPHFGDIKDHIIKQLLVELSYGLKECSAVTVSEELFPERNEREFRIEAFIMTPTELKKAIRLVKTAEILLPDDHKWIAKQLYFILTCKEGTESDIFMNELNKQ